MANLANKLGQTIQGKVNEFGSGFKSALTSGNPALFGPALSSIENALSNQAKETKKDREERKRDRQFNEENQAEQRKLDTEILKSLKSIQKMLEGFLGKKGEKSFLDDLKGFLAPLTAAVSGLLAMFKNLNKGLADLIGKIGATLENFRAAFREKITNFVQFFDELIDVFKAGVLKLSGFFDNIGKFLNDILVTRLKSLFDGSMGGIGGGLVSIFKTIFESVGNKLKSLFSTELYWIDDFIRTTKAAFFEGRLIQSLGDLKEVFGDKGPFGKFVAVLGTVFEYFKGAGSAALSKFASTFSFVGDILKGFSELTGLASFAEWAGTGLAKALKFIPILGNMIMIIEGLFAAFDTDAIASALGKLEKDVGFGDRITAFLGGLIGSIFGLFDLVMLGVRAAFGMEKKEGEETIQQKATRWATQFIDGVFEWIAGIGKLFIGVIRGDKGLISNAMTTMVTAVEDTLGVLIKTIANVLIDGVNSIMDIIPGMGSKKLKKLDTSTTRERQIANLDKSVATRPSGSNGASWDTQFGEFYDRSGKLKEEYKKQQEEIIQRATANGTYEALKRPGSLSISEALNIQANLAEDEAINGERRWQETKQYEQERAGYYRQFQSTLESGFKDMIDSVAGDYGSTAAGGGRRIGEKLVGKTFNKLGTKIFGERSGGQIGQIFTQLFGSYADQAASQIIGPALFGSDIQQSNRFFNSLASGDKKAAQEDLLKGMFGINTGMRSAIGYEEGAAQLAKDLAEVTGMPFAGAFGVNSDKDPTKQIIRSDTENTDRIVDAIYGAAGDEEARKRSEQRRASVGGGAAVYDPITGQLVKQATQPGMLGTAGSRIMDTGLRMGQAYLTKKIAGDNVFGQAIVGGMVGDLTSAMTGGGQFDIMQSVAKAVGINLPPGASIMDFATAGYSALNNVVSGSLANSIYGMGTAMGGAGSMVGGALQGFGQGMAASSSMSGFQSAWSAGGSQAAGAVAGAFGNAMLGNSLNKAISGEYSISKGFDTAVAIASAIPGIGPIAGVIGGVMNRAFGMGAKKITGQGITGTLGEDQSNLVQYADWHQKGGWFRSSKSGTNFSALDVQVIKQLTEAASSITTAVRSYATQMNLGSLPQYTKQMQKRVITPKYTTSQQWISYGEDSRLQDVQTISGYGISNFDPNTVDVSQGFGWKKFVEALDKGATREQIIALAKKAPIIGDRMQQMFKELRGADGRALSFSAGLSSAQLNSYDVSTGIGLTKLEELLNMGATPEQIDFLIKKAATTGSKVVGTRLQQLYPQYAPASSMVGSTILTDTDIAAIKAGQIGDLGRLSTGQVFKIASKNQTQWGNTLTEAQVELFETANDAYAESFKKLNESFSLQIRTSGYDMEQVLQNFGDEFVKNAFGNLLNKFAMAGERLYETFDRLSSATVNFDEVVAKLGYTFGDLLKPLASIDLFEAAAMKDTFIDLYGGMQKFLDQSQQYFDLFYTQEEKLMYYEDVGRRNMQKALAETGLDAQMSVDSLMGGIGTTMEDARINYRRMVDQFERDNRVLLAANDPETVKKLAMLHGDLAESYYVAVQAIQELDRVQNTSQESLEVAARRLFEADRNKFATGGIATGPKSGYGATLHGTEAVIPLPNGKEIPVMLKNAGEGTTIVNNNIVGNGNAALNSNPTNVFSSSPNATSGSSPNRVLSTAY